MFGDSVETHLAARGEDVDGLVLVDREEHPVAAGRLPEPIDLFAKREQLLAGLLEGVHQLGVARRQRVDARLELLDITGGPQSAAGAYRPFELFTQGGRFPP